MVAALAEAAAQGTSFGTPTPGEVELAAEIVARTPVEQVRLVNSGTEATMSAIRLARGSTGRSKIVKFAGCYHGHVDALLAAAGSGRGHAAALPTDSPPGPSRPASRRPRQRDDRAAVQRPRRGRGGLRRAGDEIAAIITEAAPGNMGVVAAGAGFNAGLAEIAHRHGALLDRRRGDDRLPGRPRRLGRAGPAGEPVDADLYTFGKVMGGGLPAAAFGGRAEIMAQLAPAGPVYQAGTLSGNPLACAAGLATLRGAPPTLYARLDATAAAVGELASKALAAAGVPHRRAVRRQHVLGLLHRRRGARLRRRPDQDVAAFTAFFHAMLARGVYLPPSAFEAWFVSAALDDAALEIVAAAAAARRPRAAAGGAARSRRP